MSSRSASAAAMALREFTIDRTEESGEALRVVCRAHGLRALIRALLRIDPFLYLNVNHERVEFNELSLFKEEYQTIPIRSVRSVRAGFVRPFWRLFIAVSFLVAAFGWLLMSALWDWEFDLRIWLADINSQPRENFNWVVDQAHWLVLGVLLFLLVASAWQWWRYTRGKQLFFHFEYGGPRARGIRADRTVTRHVDLAKVREAVQMVNELVIASSAPEDTESDVVVDLRAREAAQSEP